MNRHVRLERLRMILEARKKCWLHTYNEWVNPTTIQRDKSRLELAPVLTWTPWPPTTASRQCSRVSPKSAKRIWIASISLFFPRSRRAAVPCSTSGVGDGARARRIARTQGIAELVLLEPSRAMQGNGSADATIWTMRAEELHSVQAEFDVITCLWNVLGHIFPAAARIERSPSVCTPGVSTRRIFIDVHHRYNVRHYGSLPTALRFLRDQVSWNETNGDVVVAWDAERSAMHNAGPRLYHQEFRALAQCRRPEHREPFIVDYATGERRRWSIEGNLLYVLRPASAETA